MFSITKTYGHNLGFSACFRQWRADSHCRFLHGYALQFELEFEAEKLDDKNWVLDFGSLKPVKKFLVDTFDHKLLVAQDDPNIDDLCSMESCDLGLADVLVLPAVGCEAFAATVAAWVEIWMEENLAADIRDRGLRLRKVTVREHGANSASYEASK